MPAFYLSSCNRGVGGRRACSVFQDVLQENLDAVPEKTDEGTPQLSSDGRSVILDTYMMPAPADTGESEA